MVILTDLELRKLSSRELSELIKRAKGYNYRARIFAAREAVKQTEKVVPKIRVQGGWQPPAGGTKPKPPTTGSGVKSPRRR